MEYIYKPKGVCSNLITIELDGEIIRKVEFRVAAVEMAGAFRS